MCTGGIGSAVCSTSTTDKLHERVSAPYGLLEQLLAAAALDHPRAAVAQPTLVDAAVLATEAGVAARLAYPDYRISIEIAGPLLVNVDPLAITRILGNLLDNAATHSPAGSLIRLIGGRDGTQAMLAVQDQGPGVAAETHERIFERYTRVDRHGGPAAAGQGLGLGLYIARRLALANHGILRLSHPPGGHGACFELRLPMARPAPDPNPGRPPTGDCGQEQ